MGSTSYFVIVSREDHVIFEADLGTGTKVCSLMRLQQTLANPRCGGRGVDDHVYAA
jgi:hypothetical protein